MRKLIGQFDVKHIMTSAIQIITSEGLDRHYHKYPTRNIVLAEILPIMSVPTFKTAIFLYIVRYLGQFDVIN
jgi:hypothetical protein